VRRRASAIIVLGECMRARVISHGISPERIEVAENWADGGLLHPAMKRPSSDLTVIYPGNLGLAHDTETVTAAMRRLNSNPAFRFLFVGGGPRSEPLKQLCEKEGLSGASFLPYCSRDRLNQFLAEADIGLVTQTDSSLGSLVPSKAYSLIAAGLPILFIGPAESTVAAMIRRFHCGWELRCGEGDRLAALLEELRQNPALVEEAGALARQAFLIHYDKPAGVRRVCNALGLTQAA
jgi:colanic acid biosynthesis glycosyl transferase WcaI